MYNNKLRKKRVHRIILNEILILLKGTWKLLSTRVISSIPRTSPEKGLTLVELTVVIVLLSSLGAIIMNISNTLLKSRKLIESQRGNVIQALEATTKLVNELTSSVREPLKQGLNQTDQQNTNSSDQNSGEPDSATAAKPNQNLGLGSNASSGTRNSPGTKTFLGENSKDGQIDQDSIEFITNISSQGSNFGMIQVRYFLEQEKSSESGKDKKQNETGYTLYRKEFPAGVDLFKMNRQLLKEKTLITPLVKNVQGLNFRYYKDKKWSDQWSDLQLPVAVEVDLKILKENGQSKTIKTAIILPMAVRP